MNLDLSKIPKEDRSDYKEEVKNYLIEQILSDASNSLSSASGRRWKGLSKAYKKIKKEESGSTKANLELFGGMLDALEARNTKEGIEVGWFDKSQVPKADGHNDHSGDSKLPLRRSIPSEGQNFRPGIRKEIGQITKEFISDD